jgi:hypothetical protein
MQIRNPLAGRGTRRKSDENWDRLQQALSTAQRDLAAANQQIATLTAERDEARGRSDFHRNGWQAADREVKRLTFLLGEDAKLPATQVPAPVDNGCRDTPLANAETQPVDVRELREAVGEGDTQVLPAITPVSPVLPLHDAPLPPVTWGRTRDTDTTAIEANLGTPAPTPEFAATAVPPGIPDLAHDKVHAALGDAS